MKKAVFITEALSVARYRLVYPQVVKQPKPLTPVQSGQVGEEVQLGPKAVPVEP